jgi:nitroreductase
VAGERNEWTDPTSEFAAFERLAHARRSSLLIDRDRPVPPGLVDRLCRLVYSAPNHKRTVPWQVAVFVGDARQRLGAELCADLTSATPDVDGAKLDKTRAKYLRAPAIIVVGCRPDPDGNAARHREDLAAVAAGVENLLLGAAAAGLSCLWSSPPMVVAPRTCAFAEFAEGTELLAMIYLGWPASAPPSAERPQPVVTWRGPAA